MVRDILEDLKKDIEFYFNVAFGSVLAVLGLLNMIKWEILAAGILTTIMFLAFSNFRTRRAIKNLDDAVKEVSLFGKRGLQIFDTHKNALSRLDMLLMAKERVRIVTTNLFSFFYNDAKVYDTFLDKLEKGCKFDIVIYEPESSGVHEKQWEEGDDFLGRDIFSSCEQYLGPAKIKFPESLQIKFVKINLPFGATIIDNKFIFVSLNVPSQSRRHLKTPRIEINSSNPMFEIFRDAFEKIWQDKVYVSEAIPDKLKSFFKPKDASAN